MANGSVAVKILREIVKAVGVPDATFKKKKYEKTGPFMTILLPLSWPMVLRAWKATR